MMSKWESQGLVLRKEMKLKTVRIEQCVSAIINRTTADALQELMLCVLIDFFYSCKASAAVRVLM